MPQSIEGRLRVTLNHKYVNVLPLVNVTDELQKTIDKPLTNGTGANQVQHVYHNKKSLNAGASDELNLTALPNAFGTLNLSKVKAIVVNLITSTAGYSLKIGGSTTNAWDAFINDSSDIIVVGAGSAFVWSSLVDGGVVDSTHKMLKITNASTGTIEYEIWVIGNGSLA